MAHEDYFDEAAEETNKVDETPDEQLDNDGMDAGEAGFSQGFEGFEEEPEEDTEEKVLDDFQG